MARTADQHELQTEPALTIGKIFQDKKMVKTFVAAVISLIAATTGWVADGAVVENVTTIITIGGFIVTAIMAQVEASQRAREQAKNTRDLVYSPATVEALTGAQNASEPRPKPRTTIPKEDGIARFTYPGA